MVLKRGWGSAATRFFKKDIVLSASLVLAVLSCLAVPPDREYLGYIDFETLILLLCLMLIVEGLRGQGLFQLAGGQLLRRVKSGRGIAFVLVFLCFFSSMFITNDVALITFVPFGIMILEMAGLSDELCYIVVLMTIAANLGSMLTPVGNPQNLYLFSLSGMGLSQFLELMLPYTAASAVLLAVCILFGCRQPAHEVSLGQPRKPEKGSVVLYAALFVLCLLTVAGVLPHAALLAVVAAGVLLADRRLFARADYSLLLTFVFFFVFTGNLNRIDSVRGLMVSLLEGHEKTVSILSSQVISNVPAAMLLSGYTDNIPQLIIGTNIGGLGTLIASMASLISYKQVAGRYPQRRQRYLLIFTVFNLLFLIPLWLL